MITTNLELSCFHILLFSFVFFSFQLWYLYLCKKPALNILVVVINKASFEGGISNNNVWGTGIFMILICIWFMFNPIKSSIGIFNVTDN